MHETKNINRSDMTKLRVIDLGFTWPFVQPPMMILLSRGHTAIDVTSRGHSRINLGDKQSVKDHISTRLSPSQSTDTCTRKDCSVPNKLYLQITRFLISIKKIRFESSKILLDKFFEERYRATVFWTIDKPHREIWDLSGIRFWHVACN